MCRVSCKNFVEKPVKIKMLHGLAVVCGSLICVAFVTQNVSMLFQEAVDKYDTVVSNLEFARELQKQFQSMSDEVCNYCTCL